MTVAFDALGLPSPALFAGLAVGLARALTVPRRVAVPHAGDDRASHVVIGVMVGTLVQLDTLAAIAAGLAAGRAGHASATLALSLAAGQLMALRRGISPVTGAFSMIAGGATGITVMARELGADERMVAVLQYLRVLLIVLTLPVVAVLVFWADPAGGPVLGGRRGAGLVGRARLHRRLRAGRHGRRPRCCASRSPSLLGPMLVAAALDLGGLSGGAGVPFPLIEVAFLARRASRSG